MEKLVPLLESLTPIQWATYVGVPFAVLVLPSLLFVVAIRCCMRSTRPTPGKAVIGPGLSIHQWSQMDSALCYEEMFLQHIYKRHGIHYEPGMTVIDIGANIGIYAFYAGRMCHGNATIHCFEPMPEMYKLLEKNAKELTEGLYKEFVEADGSVKGGKLTVIPQQLGCYNVRKDVEFSFRPNCPVASTIDSGDLPARITKAEDELISSFRHYKMHFLIPAPVLRWAANFIVHTMTVAGEERVKATVIPLSDYIDEKNITDIGMLKIDVECAEEQVVAGIRAKHWPRIRQLLIEAEDYAVRDRIIAVLNKHGFTCDSAAIREEIMQGSGNELSIIYAWREPSK
jgi:hypothetical protein